MTSTTTPGRRGPRAPRRPLINIAIPRAKVQQKVNLSLDKVQTLKNYQRYLCDHYQSDPSHITLDIVIEGLIDTLSRDKSFQNWMQTKSGI